jgi:hypothetical protein
MSDQLHPVEPNSHGDYERSDIGVSGILYFMAGLAVAGIIIYFVVAGLFAFLEKRFESQATMSPLVTTSSTKTRDIPKGYPQATFPDPRLEEDERSQLNGIRLSEEQTLSSYDYIDQKAGTIRIPIDRAMDLIAQRGLPTRTEGAAVAKPAMPTTEKTNVERTADKKKATK